MVCSVQCSMRSFKSTGAGTGAGQGAGTLCSMKLAVSSVQCDACHRFKQDK